MKNILTLENDWQTLLRMFPSDWKELAKSTKAVVRKFRNFLHQVQHAINPDISLKKTIADWQEISKNLAENTRKRKPQMSRSILG